MWTTLEWIAWAASGLIFAWMVYDGWRTGNTYSEDVLLSSREGVDELLQDKREG